jgi:sugar/nucleoside kinase (ribokinase family)
MVIKMGGEKPAILGLGAVCKDWVSVVQKFPQPDEKVDSELEDYFPGGVVANYITSTQRLGVFSAFIGAIGEDSAGDWLIQDMKKEGQFTDYCIKKKGMTTATNFIIVEKSSGEKIIILSPYFTKTKLDLKDLKADFFVGAKILHTDAVHEDLTNKAVQYAKDSGLMISFDLESQIAIRGWDRLKPVLEKVDILLPNKLGIRTLTKTDNLVDAARIMLKKFPQMKLVVITVGAEGSMAITEKEVIKVPAFKIDKIVDVTGAGDTFCGAFDVVYCIKKFDIEKSLRFANAAAGLKTMKLGARTGMRPYQEVVEFLKKNGFKDY